MQDKIDALKNGTPVMFDEYHSAADMKSIMAKIKAEVPEAWVTRSPSTNRWKVFPK